MIYYIVNRISLIRDLRECEIAKEDDVELWKKQKKKFLLESSLDSMAIFFDTKRVVYKKKGHMTLKIF